MACTPRPSNAAVRALRMWSMSFFNSSSTGMRWVLLVAWSQRRGGAWWAAGGVVLCVGDRLGEGPGRVLGVAGFEGAEPGGLMLGQVGDVRGGFRHPNPLTFRGFKG